MQFLEDPMQLIQTARYLGANLETLLTWSASYNHADKKAPQGLAMLDPLLKKESGLYIHNGDSH